ncbi:SIR2 family protein [Clostridium sp. C8]|uniref:SIR2 family protein n=1 Tax=Clostridium sp. C8 TaxID=1667357 RepID=UPI00062E78F1|nr:SIR2 family protein [Clostridium sp. C8]KLE17148.1 hypothetical protein AAT22_02105 [Clostridium sp. C8]
MRKENEILRNLLIEKSPILFTGAGFSFGAIKSFDNNFEVPKNLEKFIKDNLLNLKSDDSDYEEILRYDLKETCSYVKDIKSKEELEKFLIDTYSGLKPRDFHKKITKYNWRKIYTTNIDDMIERIYKESNIAINIQNSKKENINLKKGEKCLSYYKLHGCINNKSEGFTFSNGEYTNMMVNLDYRLLTLCSDIQKEDIIFIGTSFEEPDIEYYLEFYRNAGYETKRGQIVFINPSPTLKLKRKAQELGAVIIKWTTEEFLEFIDKLNYNPQTIDKLIKQMKYEGFFRLNEIREIYKGDLSYFSKLYEGESIHWKDIFYEWDFIHPIEEDIINDIKNKNNFNVKSNVHCVTVVGKSYTGKSTILKRVAANLFNLGYDVIEYTGTEFNKNILVEYINLSINSKFVLLYDNASSGYPIIESLLKDKRINKELIILAGAREYYHNKKKYYLEDDFKSFREYILKNNIDREYASCILEKLSDKGFEGHLRVQKKEEEKLKLITKEKDLLTFMLKLNNGVKFKKNIKRDVDKAINIDNINKKIMISLALFDSLDVSYFPVELLKPIYNSSIDNLLNSSDGIFNMIKVTSNGIQIRNLYYAQDILNFAENEEKIECLYNVLVNIAAFVNEDKANTYREMFEQLTKEDRLRNQVKLSKLDIKKLYYKIKNWYENISYYWLQLGLIEQASSDFESASNHLQQAESIRPNTYQIQHALGRNYLRHANYVDDINFAIPLFEKGEEILIRLIENEEIKQPIAYSINCYLHEKINFINKFGLEISQNECKKIYEYMEIMINKRNGNYEERDIFLLTKFMRLLKEKGIYGVIKFTNNSKYSGINKLILERKIKVY